MADERLEPKDKLILFAWILMGVAGALFATKYFFIAFPEASVDFKVSRGQALERARSFVTAQGENISRYQSAIVFDLDENAKTYLERELGLKQANQIMSQEISIWYWKVRFFRPQQQEEFQVNISPDGRVTGYQHKIEEARPGASPDRETALAAAETFLRTNYGTDLGAWSFLPEEANSTQKTKRRDWSFTWERRGFKAKDAPYRLRVAVHGGTVGGAEEFLKVPEAWEKEYTRLRASNNTIELFAILPYLFLLGSVCWMIYDFSRKGQIQWVPALKLGLIVALLFFLQQLNEWPIARAGYDTNSSYASFFIKWIFSGLAIGFFTALTVVLPLLAAEPLYRRDQPQRLRLAKAFTGKGIRTKEFFHASVIGLSMAAFHIGFVVLFYMVAARFGAWAPQELNYENSVSTAFPWITGVTIGIAAATSEEFLFRLFAIPFVKRLTRSWILAIVLPAFAWGFLHSNYPQEPGYIRGIEVGLIGIVAGVVMLRWGILSTLIWHYTVDATLVGLLLLRSDNLYFKASGAIVGAAALIPLGVSGVSYLMRGRFESQESLLNSAAPLPRDQPEVVHPEKTVGATRYYEGLTPASLGVLLAGASLGIILLILVKPPEIGGYLRFKVNARQAENIANEFMRQRKIDVFSYRHAMTVADQFDPTTNEYLREKVGIEETNRIYRDKVPGILWRVRYFRDSQVERYAVFLQPDGTMESLAHALDERAPGASLSKEQAQALAEEFLRREKKIDLNQWKLVESNSEKKPKRVDHTFTWEELASLEPSAGAAPGAAHTRIRLQVQGDEVSGYLRFIQIPEQWRRKQDEEKLALTLYRMLQGIVYAGLGIAALVIFLKNLRTPAAASVPWRRLAVWSLWGVTAFIVVFALGNRLPQVFAGYDTAEPLKLVLAGLAVAFIVGAGFYCGGLLLLFGLAWFFGVRAFGEDRLASWKGMPATYYRDALWIATVGGVAFVGAVRLQSLIGRVWPTVHRSFPASVPSQLDAYVPAAQAIGGALVAGLGAAGVIALAAGFTGSEVRHRSLRILLFLLLAGCLVGEWGSAGDFAKQLLGRVILLGVVWLGTERLVRFNVLAYFLLGAGMRLVGAAMELLSQPNAFYRRNGFAVVAAILALLLWPLWAWRAAKQREGERAV
ncbi:MAG TPA: type II CAAX endopeptidase family protein [Candidatus Dormibacteraeota bacterium]|nr:type II CAAX endopeptidase family protein [Candidatus Dormibacteraeota bacterium]